MALNLRKTKTISIKREGKYIQVHINVIFFALWLLYTESYTGKIKSSYLAQKFIYDECLPRWPKKTTRGLSVFVTMCMLRSIMSIDDFKEYRRILRAVDQGK